MRILLIILGLLTLMAVSAEAEPRKISLYGSGYWGSITGPETPKDLFDAGLGFKGGLGLQLNPNVELIFQGFYASFPLNDYELVKLLDSRPDIEIIPDLEDINVDGGGVDVYGILASLRYYISTPNQDNSFKPFLTGELGFIHGEAMDDATLSAPGYEDWVLVDDEDSSTDFAMLFGVGTDFWVSPKVALCAEANYQVIFTEDDNTTVISILAGLKFDVSRKP